MVEMARFIKPILAITPPDLTSLDPRPLMPLAGLARRFQGLPQRQQAVFVQLMTMSASEFLDQWFETDPLKATMSASGIIGTYQGVKSPGTAYVLLHHYMGEIDGAFRAWGIPKGGTGSVSNAIGSAAQALGAEIRLNAPVANIIVKGGRAVGVALELGEEIHADSILSSLDSSRTFLGLLESGTLEPSFEEEVRRFKFRGSSGKVNLAVDRLPDFTCLPGEGEHLRGAISFSPSIDDMETAYDDAKYGHFSRKPYIDMIIPTLVDPSMAPPGKHVISCFVQYAPYKLAPELGTWDDQRDAFGDAVIDRIAEFAPNIRDIILHRNVQTPLDIERTTGLTEGNIFQGELSLEQLFFNRPVPGYARFRTPGPRPVAVRVVDPPGRRDHGRQRPDRGARGAPGARPEGGLGVAVGALTGGTNQYDAIVVGGGHNGLVAAAYLGQGRPADGRPGAARDGRAVPPARPSSRPGRGCRPWPTRSAGCGRRSSATSTCKRHGLSLVGPDVRAFAPGPDGDAIVLWGDAARTAEGLRDPVRGGRRGTTPRSTASSARCRASSATSRAETPPDIESPGLGDALAGLRLGRTFRGLGRHDGRTITRVLPMAVADFVAESFETDALQAAIAWRGIQYTAMGPWSAGTTAVLLADSAGNDGGAPGQTVYVRGGPGALAERAGGGRHGRPGSRSGPAPR